jgi:hypothetical protein
MSDRMRIVLTLKVVELLSKPGLTLDISVFRACELSLQARQS